MTDTLARLQDALQDRYRLGRELGQGGMATVYLAHDLRHERDVALKVLRPELAAVLGGERFLAEIKITARLDHPHILTLIDSGASDGFLWYVLPFVRGESLRDRLDREQQLPLEDALGIARQVAGALDHAHRHGVIHRDIKPENILFHEGEAMLADFGIALAVKEAGGNRLTETGLSLGTPQYMSPEQATGDRTLDARSDIYSLGAVLYEMLAGEPPVTGPTVQALIAKLLTERPTKLRVVRDTVPEAVEAAVAKALAKAPADRFPSVADFAAALEKAGAEELGGAGAPGRTPWWRSWRAAAALALVAIVAAGAWLALPQRHSRAAGFVPDLVQLTSDGNARSPSLSPDGTRLAYIAQDCDERDRCVNRLMVRDTGGAGVTTFLTSPFIEGAGWATGGRFLVVRLRGGGYREGAYAIPALGGAPRFLTSGPAASIGTSDTVLVVARPASPNATTSLQFVTVSDGIARDSVVVRDSADVIFGVPAPRGGRIAVFSWRMTGINVVRILDRAGQVLDSMPLARDETIGFLGWSPAGDALIWVRWVADLDRRVVLYRRVDAGGRLTGPTDTLLRLQRGSSFKGLTPDGAALLQQGPIERVVYALQRSGPGRLDFQIHRLASATTSLDAWSSFDGSHVTLHRGGTGGLETGRWSVIPFAGGEEHPVSLPPGEVVSMEATRPVESAFLFVMRDAGRHLHLYETALASGQVRDLGPLVDSTTQVVPVPGGGLAEYNSSTRTARVHSRPGRPDTMWTFPREPGRTMWTWWISSDTRTLWTISYNAALDTVSVGRVPLDGRPVPQPIELRTFAGLTALSYDDGSFEVPDMETPTTTGWYRVSPQGGRAVRLGDAPLQGDVAWNFSPDVERAVAVKSVDRPDIYLIRNFAQLLR